MRLKPSPAASLALCWLATGCLTPNPAFDGITTAETSLDPSSPTLTGTSTLEPTTTPPEPTTTTSTSGTTTTSTTSGTTTTSAEPTTTTTSEVSSSSTTGAPLDCWGREPDAWDSIEELLDAQLGDKPSSPRISPDGLVLYYMAETPAGKRPHRAERASLDEPFTTGALLIPWLGVLFPLDHPNVLRDETEILLAGRPALDDQLLVAVAVGNGWSPPAPMPAPTINTPGSETIATVSADATRLVFQRDGGAYNPFLKAPVWRLFEATRAAGAPAGAPFVAPKELVLPGISDAPYAHVYLCPTLAPDGLHLFFGSSFPLVLDEDNVDDALGVFSTRRDALDQPWTLAHEHTQLRADTWESCPSSVTADGCTLVFHRFKRNADPGDYRIYFARRSPA